MNQIQMMKISLINWKIDLETILESEKIGVEAAEILRLEVVEEINK